MKIRDLMTKQVASVHANDSTAVAARLMWDCDCGAIPVLDDEGRAIAMITDRDICMAALMRDRAPSAIPVSEVMSRDLQSRSPDDSVSSAEQLICWKVVGVARRLKLRCRLLHPRSAWAAAAMPSWSSR